MKVWGLTILCAAMLAASCGTECTSQSECASSEVCSDGVCVPKTGGTPVVRPKVDAGMFDSGNPPIDTGVRTDGGVGPDTGMPPDGGNMDGGVGDGGVPNLTELPTSGEFGFVWAGELIESPGVSGFHAFGLLQNVDAVTFDYAKANYPDDDMTSCDVVTRRATAGGPSGFDAADISVVPGPTPFAPFSMFPVGDGRFEPMADPVMRLFHKSPTALFRVSGSGGANSVDGPTLGVPTPPVVVEHEPYFVGTPVDIRVAQELRWEPSNLSPGTITVEAYDALYEVRLTCVIDDDSRYTIPPAAVTDYFSRGPTAPSTLEIRYDREGSHSITKQSGGTLNVTYRASQGLRYPIP